MQINVENVVKALNYLSQEDVDVINLSLSFLDNYPELEEAIKNCQNKGILIVTAVDNLDIISYPAGYENVIAVGNKFSSMQYKYLIRTNEYNCNSYRAAYVTNYIVKNKLVDSKIDKIK